MTNVDRPEGETDEGYAMLAGDTEASRHARAAGKHGNTAHPSPPTLLRLQSPHWGDWWLRHRLEVPQGERGAIEPKSHGLPFSP